MILLLTRQPNRLTAAPIRVGNVDRLYPDLQDAIPSFDDLAFLSEERRAAAVAQHRELERRRPDHADELQRNRRHRGRRWRTRLPWRHGRRPLRRSPRDRRRPPWSRRLLPEA